MCVHRRQARKGYKKVKALSSLQRLAAISIFTRSPLLVSYVIIIKRRREEEAEIWRSRGPRFFLCCRGSITIEIISLPQTRKREFIVRVETNDALMLQRIRGKKEKARRNFIKFSAIKERKQIH